MKPFRQPASQPKSAVPSAAIRSAEDARKLASYLIDAMASLLKLVEQETALVRAGKVGEAMQLDGQKTELSQRYVTAIGQLKANRHEIERLFPNILHDLHRQHDAFRAILQINLTVLATAHAVSEGIIRGVSGELQRRSTPQTYNAAGYQAAPGPRHAAPIAVSRTL